MKPRIAGLTLRDWLRHEWCRAGLALREANAACGVRQMTLEISISELKLAAYGLSRDKVLARMLSALEKAKEICRVLREFYGNTAIDIQGGEPTIYPGILELISYCRDIGLHPTLITNGLILAKPGKLEEFSDAGVRDFLVSLLCGPEIREIQQNVCVQNRSHGKSYSRVQSPGHQFCADNYFIFSQACRTRYPFHERFFLCFITVEPYGTNTKDILNVFLSPLRACTEQLKVMAFTSAAKFRHL